MQNPPLFLPPGAVTGIGSLPFRNPHTAVQCVAQTCPLIPFWPELPQCSPEARCVEQTFSAFADLVRPRLTGSGYEVVPGQLLDPNTLFGRWLDAVMGIMPVDALARQTLMTATCGLGLLPVAAVASSFDLAHQLARRVAAVVEEESRA